MAEVFISYARTDLAQVREIVNALRAETLDVWWDQDVPANAEWEPSIEAALEAARCVIVCWSPAAAASENVRAEARFARSKGRLLQAYLAPCSPPFFFGERQGADLTQWEGDRGSDRFQFLVDGVRDVLAGKRPKPGLGFRPRERRGGLALFAGAALFAAAGVGVLWIPELRERVFPQPPVIWTMHTGPSADLRPAEPPSVRPIERVISPLLIAMSPEFATEGGRAADAMISSERIELRIPGEAPVAFTWLWFTDNSDEGYITRLGNAQPFPLTRGGAREILFQPVSGYRWSQFVRALAAANDAGEDYFQVIVSATVESDGETHELGASCNLPLAPVVGYMRERTLDLKWISVPCGMAAPARPAPAPTPIDTSAPAPPEK